MLSEMVGSVIFTAEGKYLWVSKNVIPLADANR